MVAMVVLHHGVAGPGHGGPAAHAQEACADCGHTGGVDGLLMIACSALALASVIRPRLPRGAVARLAVPRAGAPALGMRAFEHLRAPPAPPDIHRLCVLLR